MAKRKKPEERRIVPRTISMHSAIKTAHQNQEIDKAKKLSKKPRKKK